MRRFSFRDVAAAAVLSSGLVWASSVAADEPEAGQAASAESAESAGAELASKGEAIPFVLHEDVERLLTPLFARVAEAESTRATVQLSAESLMAGQIVDAQKSVYQIASEAPDRFTIYLKEPQQRTRIFNDGETMTIAVAPDAYVVGPEPMTTARAVTELPFPLGPYPEPVLALTLAGADPAVSLLGGMRSVEIAERGKFRGKTPAIRLHGVQADGVSWDLWVTASEPVRPLRLLVDLTEMLRQTDQVQVPADFAYQLRLDFVTWRLGGEVDEGFFRYTPPEDATRYESLQEYFESMAGVANRHPLLGEPAPKVNAKTLAGEEIALEDLRGKTVVLDFWATWCEPCIKSLPTTREVCERFADRGVVFLAVNAGESAEEIRTFLQAREWDLDPVVDPEAKLSEAFVADAIPQTVLIGPSGTVEAVHVGTTSMDALEQQLSEDLETLSGGGTLLPDE